MKFLKYVGILLLLLVVVPYVFFAVRDKPQSSEPASEPVAAVPNVIELWQLTNKYRVSNGVPELLLSPALTASAMAKCQDMQTKQYWAHDSPTGKTPFQFIGQYTKYKTAGENLSQDYSNPQSVINAWIASQSHRENMLKSDYSQVGFAVCDGSEGVLVVQHFTGH